MRNRVFLLCLIIAVNINSVWNCVLCEMWTMVCKETMAIRAGISSGGHTVKPLILAAFNFGSLVYEIILAPLILAFWGLLAEWSNTLKIARVFKYLRPVIFAKLPWLHFASVKEIMFLMWLFVSGGWFVCLVSKVTQKKICEFLRNFERAMQYALGQET